MSNEMKIKIGADISGGVTGINQFNASLASIPATASKTTSAIQAIGDQTIQAGKSLSNLGKDLAGGFNVSAASDAAMDRITKSIETSAAAAREFKTVLVDLGNARIPLTSITEFSARIAKLKADMKTGFVPGIALAFKEIPKATQPAIDSFKKIIPGANQAGNALSNLSRVAQDAPFGFIGIQNNINPLLESFQRLKTETGSTGAAFKALGASLLGPAGIGLAIGAISSLVIVAIQKYGSLGNALKSLFGTLANAEKANQALNKAQEESNKHAGEEIARIQILASVAKDVSRSTEIRTKATKELQDVLKENNVELSKEAILNGQSAQAIDLATQSILKRARARAVEASLSDLQSKRLDLENKEAAALVNLTNKQADFNKGLKESRFSEQQRGFFLTVSVRGIQDVQKDLKDIDEQIAFILSKVDTDKINPFDTKTIKETKDVLKDQLGFIEKIRDARKEFTGKLFDANDIRESTDELIKLEKTVGKIKLQIALRDAEKAKLPAADILLLKKSISDDTEARLNDAFKKEALLLESSVAIKATTVSRVDIPENINDIISKATGFDKKIPIKSEFEIDVFLRGIKFANAAERIKAATEELRVLTQSQLEGLAGSIAEGLGAALSGEGVGGIIKPFINFMGEALIQLGKFAIKTAIQFKVLKETFTKFLIANPLAAIAIGVATIALGTVLKNQFNNQKLPGFAEGGIAKGPKSGFPVMLHGEELIVPMNQVRKGAGSGVNGFGSSIQFAPIAISIPGQTLRILLDRVDRSNGRLQ